MPYISGSALNERLNTSIKRQMLWSWILKNYATYSKQVKNKDADTLTVKGWQSYSLLTLTKTTVLLNK